MFGLIISSTNNFIHAFTSADWAEKGQAFIEKCLEKQEWFFARLYPGALIGLVVGIVL